MYTEINLNLKLYNCEKADINNQEEYYKLLKKNKLIYVRARSLRGGTRRPKSVAESAIQGKAQLRRPRREMEPPANTPMLKLVFEL